jgi:hypothetical protein
MNECRDAFLPSRIKVVSNILVLPLTFIHMSMTRRRKKNTAMPTTSVLQDLVHQNPIFLKGAEPLKNYHFVVAVLYILLG